MPKTERFGPNTSQIEFDEPSVYGALGRNGYSHAHGLELFQILDGELWLQPINSRGTATQCRIPVPRAAIPALIEELQRYV